MPHSSSDLDTDQAAIIDETIKQVAQSVNQMLLKTSTGKYTSNITPSDSTQDRTPDRQSVSDLNPADIPTQPNTQPTNTYRVGKYPKSTLHTQLQTLNRPNKS